MTSEGACGDQVIYNKFFTLPFLLMEWLFVTQPPDDGKTWLGKIRFWVGLYVGPYYSDLPSN